MHDCPSIVEIAPIQDSKPRFDKIEEIHLKALAENSRYQSTILGASVRIHESLGKSWHGDPGSHIGQLGKLFEKFIASDKLIVNIPNKENREELRKILLAQKIQTISEHLKQYIVETSSEELVPIIDESRPWIKTDDMASWMTSKKTHPTNFSHINNVVVDSKFEDLAFEDRFQGVSDDQMDASYVKNMTNFDQGDF